MNESQGPDEAPPPVRGPLQGLADVNEALTAHPLHLGTFVRGLTIGVLVGAAVAGSAIWRRWRRGGDRHDAGHDADA